jgi:subtilase family serine protease
MHRILLGGVLSAAIMLGLGTSANAQNPTVKQSGNVYYVNVCGPVPHLKARCQAGIVTDKAGNPIASLHPPISGKTPAELRDAYKITGDGSSSTIIAIVDAYGYTNAESDLGVYRSQWGIPACTTDNGCFEKLNQNGQQGNYPSQDIGWAQESALDMDMVSAMCPNCKIYLVESNDSSFQNLATAEVTASGLGVHAISNSYSGAESGSQSYESSYDYNGIAVTAATGDDGYSGGVGFPASSPHVIAVGGTHLVTAQGKRGWAETVWSGAGSGCSAVYSKPSWQKDSGCSMRMIADTSAVADPATGVAVYGPNNSGVSTWLIFGGTSVATPLVAGVYGVSGKKVKYASGLYKKPTKELFDVTSGKTGTCSPAYFCNGEVGYDGPTGNGTPNGIKAF